MEVEENQNDIEIVSKKNKLEEDFEKKIEKNQFKVNTTFKRLKNLYSDGIISKIKNHRREVGNQLKDLKGEENEEYKKVHKKSLSELKDIKASKSTANISNMSENVAKLSKKINFQINKVKKSHQDITALNALYLDDDKIFSQKNKNNSNNNRYSRNNFDNSNYDEAQKKLKLRNNFELMARKYHKDLNKVFITRFNPEHYLNNIKQLIQISPTVREDVIKIKNDVEDDIKIITDKKRFRKEYKRFMEKNVKSQSYLKLNPQLYKSDEIVQKSKTGKNAKIGMGNIELKNNSFLLPNITTEKTLVNNRDNRIKMGILRKIQKKDSKKIMNILDNQLDYMNKLHNISKEIDNYIADDNIKKKIDNNLKDYNIHKYMNLYKHNDENKKSVFKPQDYYALQKFKINNLFGDIYIDKLNAKIIEKEKKLSDKVRNNKDDYFLKISNDMKNSLNEFDNNMSENMLNIEQNANKNSGEF